MMKKSMTTLLAALFICLASFAQDLSVDELLQKYFKTTGVTKLKDIKTMTLLGKSVTMGMEAPIKIMFKRPKKMRTEVEVQGQKMISCFDGEKGWAIRPWISQTPVDLNEFEIKQSKMQSDIEGPLYDYKKKGHKVELIGKEEMEGTEVYNIRLIHKDGPTHQYYIDSEEFILLKQKIIANINGNKIESYTSFSNYKDVKGILMPFSITTQVNPQLTSQMLIEKILLNENMEDSFFQKPKN